MASNKASSDWWTETLKDLILHDQIWYNAIRALVSVESRSDSRIADAALDQLIREGLIDQDEKEVSLAMQQWLRYPAILAVSGPLRPTSSLVYETNYKQH